MTRHSKRTEESGAMLFMTLIFLTMIGLTAGALASGEVTITRQSFSTRKTQTRENGTNAGLEWAINMLRQGTSGFCLPGYTEQTLTIGGREVEVTCKGDPSTGVPGENTFALYLNNSGAAPQNFIGTSGAVGSTTIKNIVGPIYNAGGYVDSSFPGTKGWKLQAPLRVDGDVLAPNPGTVTPPCSTTALLPDKLFPLYNTVLCRTINLSVVTPPAVPDPCPSGPACTNPAPVLKDAAGLTVPSDPSCKIFRPGLYTDPPVLAPNNYFRPGVYYFRFNKDWIIDEAVLAGDPDPSPRSTSAPDRKLSTIERCPGAPAPPADIPGAQFGVTFVFGQGAALRVRNLGRIEVFSYDDDTIRLPSIVAGGLAGVTTPWAANSTVALNKDLIYVGVAQPEFILHSGIFAPESGMSLKGSNDAVELILNTVVLARVELFASASITTDNFAIHVPSGAEKKFVLMARSCPGPLTGLSTDACPGPIAVGPGGTEPKLCTVASVTVYDDAAKTVHIDNWRVDRQSGSADGADCVIP